MTLHIIKNLVMEVGDEKFRFIASKSATNNLKGNSNNSQKSGRHNQEKICVENNEVKKTLQWSMKNKPY